MNYIATWTELQTSRTDNPFVYTFEFYLHALYLCIVPVTMTKAYSLLLFSCAEICNRIIT